MQVTDEIKQKKTSPETSVRRKHLNLSLEERRRQLAEQAEKLAFYYENTKEEREIWQGGDLIDF